MEINTCSALISFYGRLEDQIAEFYEELSQNQNYAKHREIFLAFSKENKKHKRRVERTYREVITDAIEACFIAPLRGSDYEIDTEVTDNMSFSDALRKAIEIEETSYKLCVDAAEGSKGLLVDITHVFERVARRKDERKTSLESLLQKLNE